MRKGPLPPEDMMDVVFQRHDIGYSKGKLDQADLQLIYELPNLPSNPLDWGNGVNPVYARAYRTGAYIIFATRQVTRQIIKDISDTFR